LSCVGKTWVLFEVNTGGTGVLISP